MRVKAPRLCPNCSKEHNRRTYLCSTCANRRLRQDPEYRKRLNAQKNEYAKQHPEQRARTAHKWKSKTGRETPTDLHLLCAAIKRLEAALAATENGTAICEPSLRRLHQIAKRGDGFGDGTGLLRDRKSGGAGNGGREVMTIHRLREAYAAMRSSLERK